jgi:hypothetical protein
MKKIALAILISLSLQANSIDYKKLDSLSLKEVIEYYADNLNKTLPKRQNHILSIQESYPKDEDTLVIVKLLEPQDSDISSAILVDTIKNNYSEDNDFVDDFIQNELDRYCNTQIAKYLFKRKGYIRVILKSLDDSEIVFFDLAQKSCH